LPIWIAYRTPCFFLKPISRANSREIPVKAGLISGGNKRHADGIAYRAHSQRMPLTGPPDSFGHAFGDRSDLF
jgi:hypothetical protein